MRDAFSLTAAISPVFPLSSATSAVIIFVVLAIGSFSSAFSAKTTRPVTASMTHAAFDESFGGASCFASSAARTVGNSESARKRIEKVLRKRKRITHTNSYYLFICAVSGQYDGFEQVLPFAPAAAFPRRSSNRSAPFVK
jgi:hypothetical protein